VTTSGSILQLVQLGVKIGYPVSKNSADCENWSAMTIIVNAHLHVGHRGHALPQGFRFSGGAQPRPDAESMDPEEEIRRHVERLDSLGISWSVAQPYHGYLNAEGVKDTMRVNDRMSLFARTAPERFRLVAGLVEPLAGHAALTEIDRCAAELGLGAISFHHRFQGCYIDSSLMWPVVERISANGLMPIIHVNPDSTLESAWRLERLARDFPDTTFLALDALWGFDRAFHALDIAMRTPNIVWDIGGFSNFMTAAQWVNSAGAGSLCFTAPYATVGSVRETALFMEIDALPDDDAEMILGGNLARLVEPQ
jgi:predicted TIM-barrel fold metal-dependent hydrolase